MSKPDSQYKNEDLAPILLKDRSWGMWNYVALWVSMSLCIPTYMLASSLISSGMNGWQAVLTIFLGNAIVLVPMVLNGHAGAKYGIPFPVFSRASFGVRGANLPAVLRAIVACGWFGIQTWMGGFALYQAVKVWVPSFATLPRVFPDSFSLETGPAITFFIFWLVNMAVISYGIESIKKLLVFKALFLPLAALALLLWALSVSPGIGPIFAQPSKFETNADFFKAFFPGLTGMIGYWATLSLNIPDFTRYAKSQRDQVLGQAIGLPPSMTAFSLVGVIVTSTTVLVYGEMIWDPLVLAGRFESKWLVTLAMAAVAVSTLATNIAANIVSPANDFSNLIPKWIDFKRGGYLTGLIGLVILPWKLIADPEGYIFTWLIAYSGLLGPIGGIMIADYYFCRKRELVVEDLYRARGQYWYWGGVNPVALFAFLIGVIPNIPGFLVQIHLLSIDQVGSGLAGLYHYAWFVGFLLSAAVYGGVTHALSPRAQLATSELAP